MLRRFLDIFAPPIETTFYRERLRSNLNAVLLILITSFAIAFILNQALPSRIGTGIMVVFLLLVMKFFTRGDMVFARVASPLIGYLALSYLIFSGFGIHSVTVPGLCALIICARALGSGVSAGVYLVLSMGTLATAYWLEEHGLLNMSKMDQANIVDLLNLYITLIATTAAVWFLAKNIEDDRDLAYQAARDLDEQRIALVEKERQYRLLADNAFDFIWTADLDFTYTYCSPSSRRIFGYAPTELVGRSIFFALMPEESQDRYRDLLTREMRLEEPEAPPHKFDEVEIMRKDGTTGWVEAHIAFLLDDNREPIGIVGSSRDITEKIQAQRKAKEVSEQLRQAQKIDSIGQLAGGIAHDFSNMLVAIQGYSDLAARHHSVPADVRRYVTEIKKAAVRAENWTRQLLTFSRRQAMESKPVALNTVLIDLRDMLSRLIPATVEVRFDLDTRVSEILGDTGQLGQLIINLCVNARDAMPAGGTLTLQSRNIEYTADDAERRAGALPGKYVQLCVTDTGVGMDPELQQRIFEPFFTTKKSGQGTGLGLSVVHGIVVEHGGFIEIDSADGEGTSIYVNFPKSDMVAPTRTLIGMDDDLPGGDETILIVEDEEQVRDLATLVLSQAGYTVLTAADGMLGWELFMSQKDNIGAIISDVVMPNMGGRQLLKLVREVDDSIPFIFTSGYVGGSDPQNFSRRYGVEFLQKPFSAARLQQSVRTALDGRERCTRQLQVLAVDDSSANVSLLKLDIEELGHAVTTAGGGHEAIKLCGRHDYDIVFIDLQMQPLDGIDTVKIMRDQLALEAVIVGLTAHFTEEERNACLAAGMNDVMTKPPRYDVLTRLLGGRYEDPAAQQPAETSEAAPVFDVDVSLHLANNRSEEAQELFSILVRELPEDQRAINLAFESNDLDALRREVHKLNGAVRYCGVPALAGAINNLESAAKTADADDIGTHVEEMNKRVEELIAWYRANPHPFVANAAANR